MKNLLAALGLPPRDVRVPTRLQYQTTECGVAALAMILAHHGRHVSTEELRAATGVSRDCVNAADISRAARPHGLVCKAYSREPQQLEALPRPFLVHLRFIHFAVVEGFSAHEVLLNDPNCGRRATPREKFDEDFTGVVLTFEPGPDFRTRPAPAPALAALWSRMEGAERRNLFTGAACVLMAAALPAAAVGCFLAGFAPAVVSSVAFAVLALAAQGRAMNALRAALVVGQTRRMVRHILALPGRFFAYRLPSVLHGTLYAQERVAQRITQDVMPALARWLTAAGALGVLAWSQAAVALSAAVPVALCVAACVLIDRMRASAKWVHAELHDTVSGDFLASVDDVEQAQLAGAASAFVRDCASTGAEAQDLRQRGGEHDALLHALAAAATLAALGGVLIVGARVIAAGAAPAQHLAGWLLLALLAVAPLPGLARLLSAWRQLGHLLMPTGDVLACPPDAGEPHAARTVQALPGSQVLCAERIVFGYSAKRPPILQDISLSLDAGEQLGLTGPSGGGKSTLAGVLAGAHAPSDGELLVLGSPVAWVDRMPFFFEGTVRENLCLWRQDVPADRLARAVADAALDDVVAERPGGLDAQVLPRGRNFSGGQRQRMEIARALLREPRILVLDEAMDGLDPALEARIRANLRRRGCALVVVSHRAGTLAACDRVLYVANGGVHAWHAGAAAVPADGTQADGTQADGTQGNGMPVNRTATTETAMAQPRSGPPEMAPAPADEPLQAAGPRALEASVQRLAGLLGCMAVDGPAFAPDPDSCDLDALARRHGLLARQVRFTVPRWWQRNAGWLLAFRTGSAAPVLVHGEAAGSRCIDGVTGEALALDPGADLSPVAYRLFAEPESAQRHAASVLARQLKACAPALAYAAWASLPAALIALALPALALSLPHAGHGASGVAAGVIALLAASGALIDFGRSMGLLRLAGTLQLSTLLDVAHWTVRLPAHALRGLDNRDFILGQAALPRMLDRLLGAPLRQVSDGFVVIAALALLAFVDGRAAMFAALAAAAGATVPVLLTKASGALAHVRRREALATQRFLFDLLTGVARLRLLDATGSAFAHWMGRFAADTDGSRAIHAGHARVAWWLDAFVWLALAAWVTTQPGVVSLTLPQQAAVLLAMVPLLNAAAGWGAAIACAVSARDEARCGDALAALPLEPAPAAAPASEGSALSLHGVHFAYPGTRTAALRDLSLRIGPGEFIAVTGPSGAGKSTLLRLIAGFEVPQQGELLCGDRPMDEAAWVAWRERIAVVTQDEAMLSSSTLRHQLAGQSAHSVAEVWEALRTVLLDDDVARMPMGLQTIVESGKLSNGQEQRLHIARALLRKPRLLVLDEATHAIPDAMQAELVARVRQRDIACILVTHRESALQLMDRVLVLEQGGLAWEGPPSQLHRQARLAGMLGAERLEGHE